MDTLFLVASKLGWALLKPETLLVMPIALSLVFLLFGRAGAATKSTAISLGLTLSVGFFPFGVLALNPLERHFQPFPTITSPEGIIVLGGAEDIAPDYANGVSQINGAGDRLVTAMHLAGIFPDAVVLYSGGKVGLTLAEQGTYEVGPDILRKLGLPNERLLVEGQSRSTAENAAFSFASRPDGAGGTWVLVTSASHMARAYASFCAAGWDNLVPYPTDYRGGAFWDSIGWNLAGNLSELNAATKEWIGLIAYRIAGRTQSVFTADCT